VRPAVLSKADVSCRPVSVAYTFSLCTVAMNLELEKFGLQKSGLLQSVLLAIFVFCARFQKRRVVLMKSRCFDAIFIMHNVGMILAGLKKWPPMLPSLEAADKGGAVADRGLTTPVPSPRSVVFAPRVSRQYQSFDGAA